MCFFQYKLVSIVKPKKLNSSTFSISILFILRINVDLFGIWKVIHLDLLLFSDSLLIICHSTISNQIKFIVTVYNTYKSRQVLYNNVKITIGEEHCIMIYSLVYISIHISWY